MHGRLSLVETAILQLLVQLKVFGNIDSFINEIFQDQLMCDGLHGLADQYTLDQLLLPSLQQVGNEITCALLSHYYGKVCSDIYRKYKTQKRIASTVPRVCAC